jgi:hypothetical protein
MMKSFAMFVSVCVFTVGSMAQPAAPAKVTVVHAAHMLDGVSKEMQGPVTVTLVGGKIVSVKPGT